MHQGFCKAKYLALRHASLVCLSGTLAGSVLPSTFWAQTSPVPNAVSLSALHPTTYRPEALPKRARAYYELYWGVDSFSAKAVESGELIRFSYRVIDENRAQTLNDKQNEPFMIAPLSRVKLLIPSLEKVGQLRQSSSPESGKIFWMAFSNPGRLVRPGDRVDVVIGKFHINGVLVE